MSSVVDATLVFLGAVAVVVAGAGTLSSQSTTVSTVSQGASQFMSQDQPMNWREAA